MIDLKTKILDQDGQEVIQTFKTIKLVEGKPKHTTDKRPVVLMDLVRDALLKTDTEDADKQTLKIKKHDLYIKIRGQEEVSLGFFEKRLLKKLICRRYDTLFAGQALQLIK